MRIFPILIFIASVNLIAESGPSSLIEVDSGTTSFEVATNVSGIDVKGKSTALSGAVELFRDNNVLIINQIKAVVPVKSLATGMSVRDEHMRKYIFTTTDGSQPDLQFSGERTVCTVSGAHEYNCAITGTLSIRGMPHPFGMALNVKEQGGSTASYRAVGNGVVKLSDYAIAPPSQFGVKPLNEVKVHVEFTGKQKALAASNSGASR